MKKNVYLCGCGNCNNLLIDPYPQFGSNIQTEKIYSVGFKEVKYLNGGWFCPECDSDKLASPVLIGDPDIDVVLEMAKSKTNRTKLVQLANMLDLTDEGEAFTLETIKSFLLREDVDPNIVQFLEGCIKVPTPKGRKLSGSECEKIRKHFSNYVFAIHLSTDNKLYFGPATGEHEDCDDKTLSVWGYITEENLNKILYPKKEEKVVGNKILKELSWYKKLMNKLK